MSDLHQYEIRYQFKDQSLGFVTSRTAIEWAYSSLDAEHQFNLKQKAYHGDSFYGILELGPVKKALQYRGASNLPNLLHFHVCKECDEVEACPGCKQPHRSDRIGSCLICSGKKPHDHSCPLCKKVYACKLPCVMAHTTELACKDHSPEEIQEHLKKTFWANAKPD